MRYVMYKDNAGQWRWFLMSANNKKLADSGESYWNKQDCRAAIDLVKGSSAAPVQEQS